MAARSRRRLSRGLALGLDLKDQAQQRSRGLAEVREHARAFQRLPRYDGPEALELLVRWTRARLRHAKAKHAVLGVSGGVDSSLGACVVARAFPGKVTAFVLPCHSSPRDEADARALCEALGLPVQRIDLGPAFDAVRATLSPAPKGSTADGNLKTRLRTMTLFHEAMQRRALFVGTGDLDEGFVGYYTKSSGSDLAPLGSLHKDEVRRLVELALSPLDAKLARRLARKPADAGLVSGKTAEQDLGIDYGTISRALEVIFESCSLFEGGVVPRELDGFAEALARHRVTDAQFRTVAALIARARHKALGAPVLWRADAARSTLDGLESE